MCMAPGGLDACAAMAIVPEGDPMHIVHVTAELAPIAKVGRFVDSPTNQFISIINR